VIALYWRVSTPDQDIVRQAQSTIPFARDRLGADLGGEHDPIVIGDQIDEGRASCPAEYGDARIYWDKATGTDTSREGYQQMLDAVDAGEVEAVLVHSVTRMSRSIRDLDRVAERIVDENKTALHIKSEGFDLEPGESDPYQRALFQLLGVFGELEAKMAQQRTREGLATRFSNDEYHHGPAPLGFEKNDGELTEATNYDEVRTKLDMVAHDELSKRKAARELDTSRRTIGRALERPELYHIGREF